VTPIDIWALAGALNISSAAKMAESANTWRIVNPPSFLVA
jgi:hypothetical protein